MRPPFPGMDPWLENPTLWPGVHNWLITAIADDSRPKLAPRYFVGVESRTTVLTGLDIDLCLSARRRDSTRWNRTPTAIGTGVAVLERPDVQTFPCRRAGRRGDRRELSRNRGASGPKARHRH